MGSSSQEWDLHGASCIGLQLCRALHGCAHRWDSTFSVLGTRNQADRHAVTIHTVEARLVEQ